MFRMLRSTSVARRALTPLPVPRLAILSTHFSSSKNNSASSNNSDNASGNNSNTPAGKIRFQPQQPKYVYQFDDKSAGQSPVENNVANRVELTKKFLRGSAIGIFTHATLYCISFGLIYKGLMIFDAHDAVFGWASSLPYVGETVAKYVGEYPNARYVRFPSLRFFHPSSTSRVSAR